MFAGQKVKLTVPVVTEKDQLKLNNQYPTLFEQKVTVATTCKSPFKLIS